MQRVSLNPWAATWRCTLTRGGGPWTSATSGKRHLYIGTALLLPKLTASVKLQSTESSRVTGSFHVRFFPFIQNLQVALCHLCQQGRLSGDQEAEGAGASLPFLLLILLMQLKYKMWICIPKYWFTLFCREEIFVANLRTFLAYLLQA